MCIAADRSPATPRFPCLHPQTRDTATDRPAQENVNRESAVRAYEHVGECTDVATMQTNDQTAHAGIGDEHIRSAAEHGHWDAILARGLDRDSHVLRALHAQEPVRGAS